MASKPILLHLLLHIVVQESSSRLSAVVTIVVLRHEATDSGNRRILSQARHLSVGLHSVILQRLHGDGLVGSFHLLWASENLLFALLTSSTKTQNKVKGGFLLDVVVAQGASVLQLLSGEDKTLLIRGDSLLILDLGLYIIDSVAGLDIQCDGLA